MRSIIEIHLKDGRVLQEPAEVYRGGPERPFTRQELHGKYRDCAEGVLDDARLARSLELLESLDELDNVHELVETLANPAYAIG